MLFFENVENLRYRLDGLRVGGEVGPEHRSRLTGDERLLPSYRYSSCEWAWTWQVVQFLRVSFYAWGTPDYIQLWGGLSELFRPGGGAGPFLHLCLPAARIWIICIRLTTWPRTVVVDFDMRDSILKTTVDSIEAKIRCQVSETDLHGNYTGSAESTVSAASCLAIKTTSLGNYQKAHSPPSDNLIAPLPLWR